MPTRPTHVATPNVVAHVRGDLLRRLEAASAAAADEAIQALHKQRTASPVTRMEDGQMGHWHKSK